MNENHTKALEYIKNTGGHPRIDWFDNDNEPIGPMLRARLVRAGHADEHQSGEPCHHRGCKNHVSHPCEVCGRTAAQGTVILAKPF